MALWDDRLAEVWAAPGNAGAGVVVGRRSVLTARHVVAAREGDDGRILARVVQPRVDTAPWTPMRLVWEAADWDLALLAVDEEPAEDAGWRPPPSPAVVVAALGTSSEPECEAVGFPDSAVQAALGEPSGRVRQSEQVVGRVLPASQAKPPRSPDRSLPRAWMPLDAETATPDSQAGWGGMSGAGVVLPDGRLIGLVVAAEAAHQQRRLYLVPLAAALAEAEGFARLADHDLRVEARHGPAYRAALRSECLGDDGAPLRIGELEELSAFGVKPAGVPDEPTYLAYVPRDRDAELAQGLAKAIEVRRMLLVVGPSASGKSRSAAEAVRAACPDRLLVRPRAGRLQDAARLAPLLDEPAIVWLDDVESFADLALGDTLQSVLESGFAVVATVRRAALELLTPTGDTRNPAGEALSDERLVLRADWDNTWSEAERVRLTEYVHFAPLLAAVAKGISVGAYAVAGPELVRHLDQAADDEERPYRYAVARTVLDWYRTGIARPLPVDEADRLSGTRVGDAETAAAEFDEALIWATAPMIGVGRRTGQALLIVEDSGLRVHDYVLDEHARRSSDTPVANDDVRDDVWLAALGASTDDERFAIGLGAANERRTDVAVQAWEPLAQAGDTTSMFNLALTETDPAAARHWYQQAAEGGYLDAMNNLGVLLQDDDSEAARRWYERAGDAGHALAAYNLGRLLHESEPDSARGWYERAAGAGHAAAMFNLGVLLEEDDPVAARSWYERAAGTGHAAAMFNLGLLLEEDDPVAARSWYERAADAGHSGAMNNLGLLLWESEPETALGWLERGAEAGNTDAMAQVATRLVDSAPDAALQWFESAAEAGHVGAMFNIGVLLAESEPDASRRWYERAVEAGDSDAMVNLAALLEDSEPARAQRLYEHAADGGDTDAMLGLSRLLSEHDPEASQLWLARAAEAGTG